MMGTALRRKGIASSWWPTADPRSLGGLRRHQSDELILVLGAGERDSDWETLRVALDEDRLLTRSSVIVLLNLLNGFTFPTRAPSCRSRSRSRLCLGWSPGTPPIHFSGAVERQKAWLASEYS